MSRVARPAIMVAAPCYTLCWQYAAHFHHAATAAAFKHLCPRSITGFTDHCTSFVLLAAYGTGANELEKTPVMHGHEWSHSLLLEQPACLHFAVNSPEEAAALPTDFQALYDTGLRSFLSIPVATDHEVVGALTIAKEEPNGFEIEWWVQQKGWQREQLQSLLRKGVGRLECRPTTHPVRQELALQLIKVYRNTRCQACACSPFPLFPGGSRCWAACPWAC